MRTIIIIISLMAVVTAGYYLLYPVQSLQQHIVIVKRTNQLFLFDGGRLVHRFPVSTGKKPHLTPEGKFSVVVKLENPGGQLGTRWLGLNVPGDEAGDRYGIHGTDRPDLIGEHVSAGCIRLCNKHVEILYPVVQVGTPVFILP